MESTLRQEGQNVTLTSDHQFGLSRAIPEAPLPGAGGFLIRMAAARLEG
jgi:hypothetical protein